MACPAHLDLGLHRARRYRNSFNGAEGPVQLDAHNSKIFVPTNGDKPSPWCSRCSADLRVTVMLR